MSDFPVSLPKSVIPPEPTAFIVECYNEAKQLQMEDSIGIPGKSTEEDIKELVAKVCNAKTYGSKGLELIPPRIVEMSARLRTFDSRSILTLFYEAPKICSRNAGFIRYWLVISNIILIVEQIKINHLEFMPDRKIIL